jgi:hypothetical protein
MMMTENDWSKKLKKCKAERDDVFLTFDFKKIEQFYEKYKDLFGFSVLPPDVALYCDAMRTILQMDKATPEQKEKAQALLDDYRRAKDDKE